GDDRLAGLAATRLDAMGYSDIRVLDCGAPGWAAAGLRLFRGVNVPSKALGELVEHEQRLETVTPDDLCGWAASGSPFHLFDVRPPAEFQRMTLPGARNFPNGELAHRIGVAVRDPDVPIVVTCAGRTRGFIAA